MIADHMSDQLIAAVSEALGGVPAELVRRSAEARAQAQGGSMEEVLQAWSGGAEMAATPAPAPAPAPVEAAVTPEPEAVVASATPEPVEVAPAPATVTTPVQVLEPADDIEPASLGDRVRLAAAVGAAIGLVLGVVLALGSSPLLMNRATVMGAEEPFITGVEVTLTALIIVTALASAVFGALIAIASRLVPGWFHPEMTLRGSVAGTVLFGALVGAVLGAIAAPLTSGLAGETIETGVILSVRGTFLALLIGGAILGAIVAAVIQLIGEPVFLSAEVEEETAVVRHRLAGSVLIPLAGLGAIALLVLPFALLLLEFHSAAPALAIVASAGILMFAFLAAYRPGLKVNRGEFILAAAGIGIVLLFIVLAFLYWGPPAEEHSEEVEALFRLVLT
jgi:MFS family permease